MENSIPAPSLQVPPAGPALLELLLPFEMTNENEGQTKNFGKSAKIRKEFEHSLLLLGHSRKPFGFPVVVCVTRILGPRQSFWDSSSILRGNYKQLEDAMVAVGFFTDDSTRYIKHTWPFQDNSRRGDGPAILIQIFEA